MPAPTDIIAVSLDAASWSGLLAILHKQLVAPYEVTAPLIQSIQTQCMQWEQRQQGDFPREAA